MEQYIMCIKLLENRNVTIDDIANIVYFLQKDHCQNLDLSDCISSVKRVLNKREDKCSMDNYTYDIDTTSQIIDIMRGIIEFMNEETWEEEGHSIWTYQEIREHLAYDLVNLSLMIGYMKNNPDVYLEFYDSY